jgi:hypothetical protein
MVKGNGVANGNTPAVEDGTGTWKVKAGLAQMLKGGVIMDVVNAEQARIAEEAGAVAVMALERVPADIRKDGGVARMSDPKMIKEVKAQVTLPVMAKVRIGHFVEAQILQELGEPNARGGVLAHRRGPAYGRGITRRSPQRRSRAPHTPRAPQASTSSTSPRC